MKKHLLVLLIILLSTLMICACTATPSSSTESDTNDTSSQTSNNTNDTTNRDIGNNTNGDNVNLDNPQDTEDPQINVATQQNQPYYEQIYGRYIGDDFPEEYGCYYKVIKTYDKFNELFITTEEIGQTFFNDYYAVIIYEHYETYDYSTFIGYRDMVFPEAQDAYIKSDCYYYKNQAYPEGSYIKNTQACIAVPKREIFAVDDSVKEITIIHENRDWYTFELEEVLAERASELNTTNAWIIKNSEELKEFSDQYCKYETWFYFGNEDIYVLAFYSDSYINDYIGFSDFYTDGKNVYITCEKIITKNSSSPPQKPTIYFVEIPKSIIEHEMSEEIVVHFLLQKTQNY
ncbi:MAG: hypothetical protein J6A90_01195 [Clostridia bacterium]|nr:hypothetical protein [Clostridia bacterium]